MQRGIAYNALASAGARVLGLTLSLVTIGLITRYLGQVGFGYYTIILAFLFFFSVLGDLGLYNVCIVEISRPNADDKKIASQIFTLRLISGFFIFALAPVVGYFFPYPTEVKIGIGLAALGCWFVACQNLLIGVFQKYLQMDKVALAEIAMRIVNLGLVAIFIKYHFGFLFIVSALVFAQFIDFLLIYLFSRKYIDISLQIDLVFWKKLLKKSLPLGLAAIFTMFSFRLDAIMLSLMKTAGEVGIYNLAYKILESSLFFPAMFVGLFTPMMARYALHNKGEFIKTIQKPLNVFLVFIVPLIIGTLFFSRNIVVLIAGQEFAASAGVLNVLIIAVVINSLAIIFAKAMIAMEKQKLLLAIHAFAALFNFAANLLLIPRYSYYGAAITTVATYLLELAFMVLFLYIFLKTLPRFSSFFKYLFPGLVMVAIVYFMVGFHWILAAAISTLSYFVILYFLGNLKAKELLVLLKR